MSGPSQAGLWVLALCGSLALHGAVAMALVALPVPETDRPAPTQISIESLPTGTVDTLAPAQAVTPVAVDSVAEAAPTAVESLAPVEASSAAVPAATSETAAPVVDTVQPVTVDSGEEAKAVSEQTALAAVQDATEQPEMAAADALAPVGHTEVAPAASAIDQAAAVDDRAEVAAAAEAPVELPAAAAEALAPAQSPSELAVAEPIDEPLSVTNAETPLAPQEATEDRQEVAPAEAATALPTVADTTEIASVVEAPPAPAVAPLAEAAATAIQDGPVVVAPNAPIAVAPAVSSPTTAVVAAAPATTVAPRSESSAAVAPAPAVAAPTATSVLAPNAAVAVAPAVSSPKAAVVAAAPANPVISAAPVTVATAVKETAPVLPGSVATGGSAQAIAPVEEETGDGAAAAGQDSAGGEQVAMIAPDPVTIVKSAPSGPNGMPLADFLKSYEGEQCILAIPTDGAAVEALSDSDSSVSALSEKYQDVSGIPVTVSRSKVTAAQCATLSFSRSIAQYPNYPLRLKLDRREIASGGELSGRVFGLRKTTLYLFVVDDEGKAKLISHFSDLTKLSTPFSSPLTLTPGTDSAVQLLVAIASDGPLRTAPTKLGVVAEEFFDRLTSEIRDDQRPILYGITSFVVRSEN